MSLTNNVLDDILLKGLTIKNPKVQILEYAPIQNGLYRAAISDGVSYLQVIIGSNVGKLIANGSINEKSVFSITNYNINLNGKQKLIILNVDNIEFNKLVIGNPKKMLITNIEPKLPVPPSIQNSGTMNNSNQKHTPTTSPLKSIGDTQGIAMSISNLNNFLTTFSIIARVINKSQIREYNNAQSGKYFSVVLKDIKNKEIKGTFFNSEALRFYDEIEQGLVYKVSGGRIKYANQRYNTTNCEFEITFDNTTIFEEISDDASIPGINFVFIKFDQLSTMKSHTNIDIIAYVISADPLTEIITKRGPATKRRIEICDDTGFKVDLTLWGNSAQQFSNIEQSIIRIKDAQIVDYRGISVSTGLNSIISINPPIPESARIRSWWDTLTDKNSLISLTTAPSNPSSSNESAFIFLSELNENDHAINNQFTLHCTILEIPQSRKPFYFACPNEKCHFCGLKLNDNNEYYCPRCSSLIESPVPRYSFSLKIGDSSGSSYATVIGEDSIGKAIFGFSAPDLCSQISNYTDVELRHYYHQFLFKELQIRVKCKEENNSTGQRLKLTVADIQPENYIERTHYYYNKIINSNSQ